jgi:hypothetical protein
LLAKLGRRGGSPRATSEAVELSFREGGGWSFAALEINTAVGLVCTWRPLAVQAKCRTTSSKRRCKAPRMLLLDIRLVILVVQRTLQCRWHAQKASHETEGTHKPHGHLCIIPRTNWIASQP